MTKLTETELAWLAGFFDGEGYVGIKKGASGTYSLHVTLTQTNRAPLDWAAENFGGSVAEKRRNHDRWAKAWAWEVTASKASAFLATVRPYLRLKGPQADVALAFQARRGTCGVARSAELVELDERDSRSLKHLKRAELPPAVIESPQLRMAS